MKKTRIIRILLLLSFFSIAAFSEESAYTAKGMPGEQPSRLERMRKLRRGTSYFDVAAAFGEPDESLGSGLLIVGYKFENTKIIMHFFTGETLQGLCEIKSSGEKTVYFWLEE